MKRKFFINLELGIFIEVFMLILIVICACFLIFLPTTTPLNEDIALLTILIIMLFVMPLLVMILILFVCFPIIEVDEEKITKKLFGIKLKSFKWEEVSEIKTYGNIVARTISFYKSRKDRIFIYCNKKKISIIQLIAPEFIKQQLEVKINI